MPLTHHPLTKEFPEHKDQIHKLKIEDRHFSNLMEKYEAIDKQIYRIESGEEPTDNNHLENLKMERVGLKDTLYQLITAA